MSTDVTLVNKTRQTRVIVLDDAAFRTRKHGFAVKNVRLTQHGKDGVRRVAGVRRSIPGSLTLLPLQSVSGLPPEIRRVPQVQSLLAAGVVEIKSQTPRGVRQTGASESQTPRGVQETAPDSGQSESGRATLGGRTRARIEK